MTATSALLKIVGYLSGLSSPSVTESKTKRKSSPEIVRRRAHQVPDIFDEQKSRSVQVPAFQRILHHGRLEMADCAGNNLFHGGLAASQAGRIIFRGEVADQRRDPVARMKKRQRFLKESGLAGTRTGNQADGQHAGFAKTLAQRAREYVILLQDIFSNFHQPGFRGSLLDLQRYDFQFFPVHDFGSRRATFGAAKPLNRVYPPRHLALRAKYFHGNFLNQKLRAFQRRVLSQAIS